MLLCLAISQLPDTAAHTPVYTTDRLQEIGEALGLTIQPGSMAFKGKTVRVTADRAGRIDHIGYTLAPSEMSGNPAIRFIERRTLETALRLDRAPTTAKQLAEDDINLSRCTMQSLPALAADSTISNVSVSSDGHRYRVAWQKNGREAFTVDFPNTYDLLTGCDMDEYERRLPAEIKAFPTEPFTPPPHPPAGEMQRIDSPGVLATPHTARFISELSSASYYDENRHGLVPVNDSSRATLTAANLFTGAIDGSGFSIDLRLRVYGKEKRFSVPLRQLTGYFISRGCTPYFGVIEHSGTELVGEVLFDNPAMGYCHAMKVTLLLRDLAAGKGNIKARLVSYIPASKISDIFSDIPRPN